MVAIEPVPEVCSLGVIGESSMAVEEPRIDKAATDVVMAMEERPAKVMKEPTASGVNTTLVKYGGY